MSVRHLLLATAAAVSLTSAAHATVFDLSGSNNKSPTFSITTGGQTATFTSPAGNGFAVQNAAGLASFPFILLDNNFSAPSTLTISFSAPVTGAVSIPFLISDAFTLGGDTLTATTNAGLARTFSTTPDNLTLAEPEGTIAFTTATPITSLTLSAKDPTGAVIAFGIGNVTVSNATVPEPISMSILGAGLLGFAALRRRAV